MNLWFGSHRLLLEFVEICQLPFEFLVFFCDPLALFSQVIIEDLELVNLNFLSISWYLCRHSVSFLFSFLLDFLDLIFNDISVPENINIFFKVHSSVSFSSEVSLKEHFSLQYFFPQLWPLNLLTDNLIFPSQIEYLFNASRSQINKAFKMLQNLTKFIFYLLGRLKSKLIFVLNLVLRLNVIEVRGEEVHFFGVWVEGRFLLHFYEVHRIHFLKFIWMNFQSILSNLELFRLSMIIKKPNYRI